MAPPVPSIAATDDDDVDNQVPMFPSLNSAQRHVQFHTPKGRSAQSGLSGLRVPAAPGPSRLDAPVARKKVALEPGCSPLDWARLKSTTDLRVGSCAFMLT